MKPSDLLWILTSAVLLSAYASALLWSKWGKAWSRREPPAIQRPFLEFWGLPPDASGNERMVRGEAVLLLTVSGAVALIALVALALAVAVVPPN